MGSREMDHIQPRALFPLGGATVASCARCNRLKGAAVSGLDPLTHLTVPLFNPLAMRWDDHFLTRNPVLTGATVVGTTPQGRATAALLFRDTRSFLQDPGDWPYRDTVDDFGLIDESARLLGLYRRNRWRDLESGLNGLLVGSTEGSERERRYSLQICLWLRGSMATKRGNLADLRDAGLSDIAHGAKVDGVLLPHVLECQAAANAHESNHLVGGPHRDRAARAAVKSYQYLAHRVPERRSEFLLRARAAAATSGLIDRGHGLPDQTVDYALERLTLGDFAMVALVLDCARSADSADRLLHNRIYDEFVRAVPSSGLGQNIDLIQEAIVRRTALVDGSFEADDPTVLDEGVDTWLARHGMQNELRELKLAVLRLGSLGLQIRTVQEASQANRKASPIADEKPAGPKRVKVWPVTPEELASERTSPEAGLD